MSVHRAPSLLAAALTFAGFASPDSLGQVDPLGRSVLFIRGADGTGGPGDTENLSDIDNFSTAPGNHGFGWLRALLELDGFQVSQSIESSAPLSLPLLLPHRIVVMGSNNGVFPPAEVDAFDQYIDAGGSALFMSDANWGPLWGAAAISDNLFLDRYGAQVYQDSGQTALMLRADPGRYIVPAHPVLSGPDGVGGSSDVDAYDGEGVSLFQVFPSTSAYQAFSIVSASGLLVRQNTVDGSPGPTLPAGPNDSAMVVVETPETRIVGHFDRNTFFNPFGAGTDITNWHNGQLALDLFRYLASVRALVQSVGAGCGTGGTPTLSANPPALGGVQVYSLTGAAPNAPSLLFLGLGAASATPLPGGCVVQVPPVGLTALPAPSTDGAGAWTLAIPIPQSLSLSGQILTVQAAILVPGGPLLGIGEASNGLQLRLGYPQ